MPFHARPMRMLCASLVVGVWIAPWVRPEAALAQKKAAHYVAVSAIAEKANPDGKQSIRVLLDIDENCYMLANPVGNEALEHERVTVVIRVAGKPVPATIKYPAGSIEKDNPSLGDYRIYKGKVVIEATIDRAAGDTSPMEAEVRMHVQTLQISICIPPSTVRVPIK